MVAAPHPLESRDERRQRWTMVLVMLGATVAAYANSLHGPFVFDDLPSILENTSLRSGSSWLEKFWPPANSVSVAGRPILNASFALNHAISGDRTWSYHLLNGLIHFGAGLALFGWLRRTLQVPRWSAQFGSHATWLAGLIALLWLVHPLQTQAVTYTVQRAESLMGFFFLFTFYAMVRGVQSGSQGWLMASLGAGVLGVGTKEVMVAAPLLLLLYDRTFLAGSFAGCWRERKGYYAGIFSTWVLLAGLIFATGGNRGGSVGWGSGVSFWAYGLTQLVALTHYLRLSVWPYPLVFEYGTFWIKGVAQVWPQLILVFGFISLTLVGVIRRSPLGFAGAWCCCILAPTTLVPGTTQMIVEHRMYLPLVAVLSVILLSWYCRWPRLVWPVGASLVVTSITLTAGRNFNYQTAVDLWGDTVGRRPENGRAQGNYAQALVEAGRPHEALAHYAAAARLLPNEPRFPYNLGVLLMKAGRVNEAVLAYEVAVTLAPADMLVRNNLAVAYAAKGEWEKALVHSTVAVRAQPENAELHYNRGSYLSGLERAPEAIDEYQTALRLRPDYAAAQTNLGNEFLRNGLLPEARTHYESALRLEPQSAEAHANLALALLRAGEVTAARAHYATVIATAEPQAATLGNLGRAVLKLDQPSAAIPLLTAAVKGQVGSVELRLLLAEACFQSGEFTGAAQTYREILVLQPANAIARQNLAVVEAKLPR